MVRLYQILFRRGHYIARDADPVSFKHFKFGPVKWRDHKSSYVEPPYWYKWSIRASPYSPEEQQKIRRGDHVGWYMLNYDQMKITPPDKWLFRVGDKVQILKGKDKGKTGDVIRIVPERNWVVVGGRNYEYTSRDGEVLAQELPLEHDEVSLLDPVDQKPTEVALRADKDGSLVRVSLKSGHIIVDPPEFLHDWTPVDSYLDEDKDTSSDDAMARTFVPSVKSIDDELKSLYGIDDGEPKEFFWY